MAIKFGEEEKTYELNYEGKLVEVRNEESQEASAENVAPVEVKEDQPIVEESQDAPSERVEKTEKPKRKRGRRKQ